MSRIKLNFDHKSVDLAAEKRSKSQKANGVPIGMPGGPGRPGPNTSSTAGLEMAALHRPSVENAKAIDVYGSSVGLTNGMVIIFDLSEYNIYYPAG